MNFPISEDDPPETDTLTGYIYERTAGLNITLLDQKGDNLLLNSEFADRIFPVQVGEENLELKVTDGSRGFSACEKSKQALKNQNAKRLILVGALMDKKARQRLYQ